MNHKWTMNEPLMNHKWTMNERSMNHQWTVVLLLNLVHVIIVYILFQSSKVDLNFYWHRVGTVLAPCLHRIWHRVGTVLAPYLAPCWYRICTVLAPYLAPCWHRIGAVLAPYWHRVRLFNCALFQKQLDDKWIFKIVIIVELTGEFFLGGQMQTRFSILRFRINICTARQK